jgi:hypothetical protein
MGASAWSYFVPYDADVNRALRSLHAQEFGAGRYYVPGVISLDKFPTFEEFVPERSILEDPDEREDWLEMYESEKERAARAKDGKPKFESIEDLIEFCAEDGTHSILDIPKVGESTALGESGPLSTAQLQKLFGSTKPTRAMVATKKDAIQSMRSRGLCTYVVVYAGDEPAELFFAGFSGD